MPLTAQALEIQVNVDRKMPAPGHTKVASTNISRPAMQAMVESPRLDVPRRGHVLSTAAEIYGSPIRKAVATLSTFLARKPCAETADALRLLGISAQRTEAHGDTKRLAWIVISIWVTGVATKAIPVSASLAEAAQWFFGCVTIDQLSKLLPDHVLKRAETGLRATADPAAYFDLLPYVLDPHGPGSRLSVQRDPTTRAARSRKRADGVFYTPADVAEYMTSACLDAMNATRTPPSIFDPACGTGVFLRAALRELRKRHPSRNVPLLASDCLFGVDIDRHALDAAAFVILAELSTDLAKEGTVPATMWQQLRLNLACVDTLSIDPAVQPPIADRNVGSDRLSISLLFPSLKHGPTVILGNPPYADLGDRSDFPQLGRIFRSVAVRPQAKGEIYPAFVEQMIRLAGTKTCAGALVLPLSIACNVGPQFGAIRALIAGTKGLWKFAFFDREPHALFGEDVKTRNAIILWSRASTDTNGVVATGPLRKWRGDSRAAMFGSLRFTKITTDIRRGIPKVDGDRQANALTILGARWSRLEQAVVDVGRVTLASTPNAGATTVFVGPTAYNFLSVFLTPPRALLRHAQELSEHPLHSIDCASREDAYATFAILSSHLAYWWWHTHGDGFHVSNRFICELPFGLDALTGPHSSALSDHGRELWSMISSNPIKSLNRGRTSLAYSPNGHDNIRRKIDQVLADIAGLDDAFVNELQQFTAHTVSATLRDHDRERI